MVSGPVEKVHMIILMQPNIQEAIDFYIKLGINLVFHIKDRWAEMKVGEIKIGLCPTSQALDGNRTGFVLQVADLKKVYETYKDTIPFLGEPKEAVHGIMASFKDPGGNILDLYQPTPEKVAQLIKDSAQSDKGGSTQVQDAQCKKKHCCRAQQPEEVACG